MIESRLFRTLAAPLGVAVLFLLITPKLCSRAVMQVASNRRGNIAHTATTPVAQDGLVIDTPAPAAGGAPALQFPDGLDSSRIEYLIEIDQAFAAPATMTVTGTSPITQELVRLEYVQKNADGSYAPTRDGLINVNGATETADGWIVPVAQRKFGGVNLIAKTDDGYDVSVLWRWQPTAIGASILPNLNDHVMIAEFVGGAGHWVLSRWIRPPDDQLR